MRARAMREHASRHPATLVPQVPSASRNNVTVIYFPTSPRSSPPSVHSATRAPTLDPFAKACFSGSTLVTVKNMGTVTMDNLQLGDLIMTANGRYEPVYSFGHRAESMVAEYLQFLPSNLEVSADHMVFVVTRDGNSRALPAAFVKVGDQLMHGETVTEIMRVHRKGLYAPFTPSGTLVVNGVGVSSYIALQASESLTIGSISTGLSFQFLALVCS